MHWTAATGSLLLPLIRHSRLGLMTDLDGTLSPIVLHPADAQITSRNRDLLRALSRHLPLVAVISGRTVADLRERVGLPEPVYVGNHGLEWWKNGRVEIAPEAARFRPALDAALAELRLNMLPGMVIEDKGATLSVHYRLTADPDAVETAFRPVVEQIAAHHTLILYEGKRVFELRPPLRINKGTTFARLVESYQLDAAVYLGDDTTDADALRLARHLRETGACYALGIGVESTHTPASVRDAADLFAGGIQDVEAFLSWLLKAVSASRSC